MTLVSNRRARVRLLVTALSLWAGVVAAQVKTDPLVGTDLPAKPAAHWVWMNDVVFHYMTDGKAFLIDGDSGHMLGMLSTGYNFAGLWLPRSRQSILSPEIYFSRGTRGTRTDVVTIYDPKTLTPRSEIAIPPKRISALPIPTLAGLSDDDRFMMLYNFTPAQSVSVVDLRAGKFVGEIDIAGCALVYPTGARRFFSLCGDGTALNVSLDEAGRQAAKARTAPLFDPEKDPVTEGAVRDGNAWVFASFSGEVVPIETVNDITKAGIRWSMLDDADRRGSWRPGGLQHLALHLPTHRLYCLMHVGGIDTHKDPGTEVWVFDLAKKQRVQRIKLASPATSIAVSGDPKPLLFAIFLGAAQLEVYDVGTGKLLRTVKDLGFSPATLTAY